MSNLIEKAMTINGRRFQLSNMGYEDFWQINEVKNNVFIWCAESTTESEAIQEALDHVSSSNDDSMEGVLNKLKSSNDDLQIAVNELEQATKDWLQRRSL